MALIAAILLFETTLIGGVDYYALRKSPIFCAILALNQIDIQCIHSKFEIIDSSRNFYHNRCLIHSAILTTQSRASTTESHINGPLCGSH
eukprot:267895_1